MNIITLTTDMGLKDHYVASVKGTIYSLLPTVTLVDISHQIKPFNYSQAAFFIKSCFEDFPENSVHIIGVDAEPLVNLVQPDLSNLPLIIRYKKHFFIGIDNGFFSLLVGDDQPDEVWVLEDVLSKPSLMNFSTKNILAPAACHIASGQPLDLIASKTDRFKKAFRPNPVIEGNTLKGAIIHIDHYGNVITNITKSDFLRMGTNTPFTIYFRQKEYYIDTISLGYNEVPNGEKVALFNDSELLEIAINKGTPESGGGASTLFGLRLNDIIRIEFTPRGSADSIASLF